MNTLLLSHHSLHIILLVAAYKISHGPSPDSKPVSDPAPRPNPDPCSNPGPKCDPGTNPNINPCL